MPSPPERILASDPALLMRGGAERQIGLAEQAVVRDDAVTGGEHVGRPVCMARSTAIAS